MEDLDIYGGSLTIPILITLKTMRYKTPILRNETNTKHRPTKKSALQVPLTRLVYGYVFQCAESEFRVRLVPNPLILIKK